MAIITGFCAILYNIGYLPAERIWTACIPLACAPIIAISHNRTTRSKVFISFSATLPTALTYVFFVVYFIKFPPSITDDVYTPYYSATVIAGLISGFISVFFDRQPKQLPVYDFFAGYSISSILGTILFGSPALEASKLTLADLIFEVVYFGPTSIVALMLLYFACICTAWFFRYMNNENIKTA